MDDILAVVFMFATSLLAILRAFFHKEQMLTYPFLASMVVVGWLGPQALRLIGSPILPPGGFAVTMIYVSLCMLAISLLPTGTSIKPPKRGSIFDPHLKFDERKLLMGAAALSAVGAVAFAMILSTQADKTEEGLVTGIVTIYFFFFDAQFIGLALSLLLLLRKKTWFRIALVALNYLWIGIFVVFGGRRGPALDLICITLCALWFERKFLLPRAALLLGGIGGALVTNVIGEYRSLVQSINEFASEGQHRLPTFDEIAQIDFLGKFFEASEEGYYEAYNAICYISTAFQFSAYDYGTSYWNFFVFRFIPGQLVGKDFKETLMLGWQNNPATFIDYTWHLGTTMTGFADTFSSFSFFGVLVFIAITLLLRRWWNYALSGSLPARLLYCASLSTAMHAITHTTAWFLTFLPQLFIFALPALYFAKKDNLPSVNRSFDN